MSRAGIIDSAGCRDAVRAPSRSSSTPSRRTSISRGLRTRSTRFPELPALIRRACSERDGGPAVLCQRVGEASSCWWRTLFGGTRLLASLDADSAETVVRRLIEWRASLNTGTAAEPSRDVEPLPRLSRLLPRGFRRPRSCSRSSAWGRTSTWRSFPFPRWSVESSPPITNAVVFFPGAVPGQPRIEQPALQVADANALTVHWTAHHAGPAAYEEPPASKTHPGGGRPGSRPRAPDQWAARALAPPVFRRFNWRRSSVERGSISCGWRTVEIDVPADAEIVIEGYVDPLESPSGRGVVATGLGIVTERTDLPLLRITAITHRANPHPPHFSPPSFSGRGGQFPLASPRRGSNPSCGSFTRRWSGLSSCRRASFPASSLCRCGRTTRVSPGR